MNRLAEKYKKEVAPALVEQFGIKNTMSVPKIEKIVINAGLGKSIEDSSYVDAALEVMRRITGQQPVKTLARKSISNFKIREGMVVGAKVTLRGEQMYAFLDKLINITMARVRDFRGLSRGAFDGKGNYSIGFREHIVFPEISADDVEKIIGLEVNIVTSTFDDKQGEALLEKMGFPFEKIEEGKK